MDICPQETCRGGPAGASRKAAECEHGKGATGHHRAESPSEPASSVQGAPKFAIHVPAYRRGEWLPTIGRIGRSIGSKAIGGIVKSATPQD